jgi:hypothetical protein
VSLFTHMDYGSRWKTHLLRPLGNYSFDVSAP